MITRFLRLPALLLAFLIVFGSSSFATDDASGRFFVGLGFDYGFTGQLKVTSKDFDPLGTGVGTSMSSTLKNDVWNGALLLGYRNDSFRFTAELSPTVYQYENIKVKIDGVTTLNQRYGYAEDRVLVAFDKLIPLMREGAYANVGILAGQNTFITNLDRTEVSVFVFGAQMGINYDVEDWTVFANLRYLTSTSGNRLNTPLGTLRPMYQNNFAITFGVAYNF